jgi:hypothetical protein
VGTTIKVTATPDAEGWTCKVTIENDSRTVTEHTVIATARDLQRLAPGSSVELLVKRSFEFLLERESPQSILRRFALTDIERYFPEYPTVIATRV